MLNRALPIVLMIFSSMGGVDSYSLSVFSSGPSALWPVDLKLTHLDWKPETPLIHFQGKHPTVSEQDYINLQSEIQRVPKAKAAVDIGDLCLVEDVASAQWYRGRVQGRREDLFDVFLIDYGNILSVGAAKVSACSDDLFSLLPKLVCGFLSNVLVSQDCCLSAVEQYFSKLIGKTFTGHTQALLPYKVLILEIPEINSELAQHGFGRHVDTETFLFLVEMLTEIPLKRDTEPAHDLLIKKPRVKDVQLSALQAYKDLLSFHGPRLQSETQARIRVTAAVSAQLFYCQMCSTDEDLAEISWKLARVYEGGTKETKCQIQDNLGLLCAVKGKDWMWHRGFLPFLPDKSQIRVFFIDYGFFEFVNVEDVHRLPHSFNSIPLMAFPCSLSEVDEDVEAQQLSFLKSGLVGSVLDVEIRGFNEKEHLHTISISNVEVEPIPKTKLDSAAEDLLSHNRYLYLEKILQETFVRTLGIEEMREGTAFVGYVVYAQNPDRFWMRSQKRNPDFEEMTSNMGDHFREVKTEEEVLVNPKLGTLCCAMYEQDLHFYRALVIDQLLHGYEVLFIDFGNIERVPHKLVKKIPRAFADTPAFAFCCSLVNVRPLDDVWTTSNCEVFRKTVSKKVLQAHVVQMRKSSFVVNLYEEGQDGAQSISELVAEKLAKHQRHAETTDMDREMEQLKICSAEEEETCESETETAQIPVSFKSLNIKPGCQITVSCSCVTSPSDFWCLSFNKVQALDELMAEIQLYYSTHTVPLQPGDSCCVIRSPQDKRWYRALIINRHQDLCSVRLVDYGYSVYIRADYLQQILPEFLHLEGQAFWCSLSRLIVPADPVTVGGWSPLVCNLMKSVLHDNCSLRCIVVSQWSVKNRGLCNIVELYSNKLQPSVTGFLLERNLAREAAVSAQQMSSDFPDSFVYSSFDLNAGGKEEVFVTYIVSQEEIYCQLERNIDVIEKLEMKISEEAQKRTPADSKAVVKNLCLAKYFDGQWYRGLVRPVQSPAHLSVFFVDYGNSMISEKSQLMSVPADSADLLFWPMQALRFRLASVPGGELYADVSRWLSDTLLNKQVTARVVTGLEDGSFDVELFHGDVSVNQKVTELIIRLLPKPKPVLSLSLVKEESQPAALLLRKKPAARKKPVRRALASRTPEQPTASPVCVQVFKKNSRQEPIACAKEEPGSLQRDPEEQQAAPHTSGASVPEPCVEKTDVPQLSSLPEVKVSEGLKVLCFVSHIDALSRFFLQQAEDEPAILKMVEDLNSDAFRGSLKRVSPTSLQKGDLVLAEYEEDGALYRSAVTHREGSSVKVEFVDYGNSSVLEGKIFSIPEEFLGQPRFSIQCSLSDNHTYQNEASFAEAVMEKPILVQFLQNPGPQWEVVIVEGAADPPEPPEATEESKSDGEEREDVPENSPGRAGKRSDVTETVFAVEAVETDEAPHAVHEEKSTLTPPICPSSKLKRVTRCCGRRTANRFKRVSKGVGTRRSSFVKPKGDPVTPLNIKSKDTENCTLLSVLSDGSFYVRLQRSAHLLSALERSIFDSLHRCELLPAEEVKHGLKCLVQLPQDQRWHRAVVRDVLHPVCLVLLDDHGIMEEVSVGSIRRRCHHLAEVPKLAVLCRMNASEFGAHLWWRESLQPLVGSEVRLIFVGCLEAGELWKVEMIVSRLFLQRQPSPQETNEPMASQPQRLSFAPVELDRAHRGFAAAVTNPFEFSVLLEDSLLVLKKVSLVLGNLAKELPPLPEAHALPGSCCLLKSRTKKKWCRAEIVHSASTIILNLLDYGIYECMAPEDAPQLRMLPLEIRNLPKVIHPCVLRGVKPLTADKQWSNEAACFFQNCLSQKTLHIFFRESVSDTKWKVDILADGVHVAKQLVDVQQAQYVDIVQELR